MKIKFNVRRELKIGAAILVVAGIIAFTEHNQQDFAVRDISVKMMNSTNNHFLDEADILSLMDVNVQNLRGAKTTALNLKEIEKKIKRDPFISEAELYTDLKGNLVASVELRRPVARIVRNDGPDGYIAEDGTIMPVSEKFTARVLLVSGAFVKRILRQNNLGNTDEGRQLLKLIHVLREDEFWNAQIAQLDIDAKGKITMFPQIGNERIEFGKAVNETAKLRKLKIFYKEILTRTGWNKYRRVNLEYEGQIVAE
jgi:cell division protein FtsQ